MPNVSRIYSDYLLLVVKKDYFFEIFETLVGIVQFLDDANRPEILITILYRIVYTQMTTVILEMIHRKRHKVKANVSERTYNVIGDAE